MNILFHSLWVRIACEIWGRRLLRPTSFESSCCCCIQFKFLFPSSPYEYRSSHCQTTSEFYRVNRGIKNVITRSDLLSRNMAYHVLRTRDRLIFRHPSLRNSDRFQIHLSTNTSPPSHLCRAPLIRYQRKFSSKPAAFVNNQSKIISRVDSHLCNLRRRMIA
jgi:hypothetical protein